MKYNIRLLHVLLLIATCLVFISCEKEDAFYDIDRYRVKNLKNVWNTQIAESMDFIQTIMLQDGNLLSYTDRKLTKIDSSNGMEIWSIKDILAGEIIEAPDGKILTSTLLLSPRNTSIINCISDSGEILWNKTITSNKFIRLVSGYDNKTYGVSFSTLDYPTDSITVLVEMYDINEDTGDISIINNNSYTIDNKLSVQFSNGKLFVPDSDHLILVSDASYRYRDDFDICVLTIDFKKNKYRTKTFGGYKYDEFYDVTTSPDGNFYILGNTKSKDGDIKSFYNYENYDSSQPWILKLDSSLNIVWEKVLLFDNSLLGVSISYGQDYVYLTITRSSNFDDSNYYGIVRLNNNGEYSAIATKDNEKDFGIILNLSNINSKGEAFFYHTVTTDEYYNTVTQWISKNNIDD